MTARVRADEPARIPLSFPTYAFAVRRLGQEATGVQPELMDREPNDR
ncbi:hypothetical protein AB0P15_33745 [Streptomyces sp. NPDC087917]